MRGSGVHVLLKSILKGSLSCQTLCSHICSAKCIFLPVSVCLRVSAKKLFCQANGSIVFFSSQIILFSEQKSIAKLSLHFLECKYKYFQKCKATTENNWKRRYNFLGNMYLTLKVSFVSKNTVKIDLETLQLFFYIFFLLWKVAKVTLVMDPLYSILLMDAKLYHKGSRFHILKIWLFSRKVPTLLKFIFVFQI